MRNVIELMDGKPKGGLTNKFRGDDQGEQDYKCWKAEQERSRLSVSQGPLLDPELSEPGEDFLDDGVIDPDKSAEDQQAEIEKLRKSIDEDEAQLGDLKTRLWQLEKGNENKKKLPGETSLSTTPDFPRPQEAKVDNSSENLSVDDNIEGGEVESLTAQIRDLNSRLIREKSRMQQLQDSAQAPKRRLGVQKGNQKPTRMNCTRVAKVRQEKNCKRWKRDSKR